MVIAEKIFVQAAAARAAASLQPGEGLYQEENDMLADECIDLAASFESAAHRHLEREEEATS